MGQSYPSGPKLHETRYIIFERSVLHSRPLEVRCAGRYLIGKVIVNRAKSVKKLGAKSVSNFCATIITRGEALNLLRVNFRR